LLDAESRRIQGGPAHQGTRDGLLPPRHQR
jgi:hypothetical protein